MAQLQGESVLAYAVRCHTPRQFRRLLADLRSVVPYRSLACKWGNSRTLVLTNIVDVDFPRFYLGWYFATGMCRKDPIFKECMATQQPQMVGEVMSRLRDRFDPEYLKKLKEYGLQHGIAGGVTEGERLAYFSLIFSSDAEALGCLGIFRKLLPALAAALIASYPYPVLTQRKRMILQGRAHGKMPDEIASELSISIRTVKMHLEEIKKKLYAVDQVHAVWIGGQTGLIG
jgi:DNA-binding CsgD family transcriptional regulator